jgi:integrase
VRQKYQRGSLKKQKGKWVGMFYDSTGSHRSRVLGPVKSMTKTQARAAVNKFASEANAKVDENRVWTFKEFVTGPYFDFYGRKWKRSTRENNVNRVSVHLVASFGQCELPSFKRDALQDLLDEKAKSLSFSVVDHLRWDLKQIFDMAVAEGLIERNPALLLFTPKEAAKPVRRVLNLKEVQIYFEVLGQRERLIARLAIIAGMRPGEIFGLTWEWLTKTYADIRQRVYRGIIDTPKTNQSVRHAALPEGLLREIEVWREFSAVTRPDAWVFPSERMTPLSKDNCWRRSMCPKLAKVGLEWANFLVLRRTHATLMKALGVDGKLVADQLGHSLDVSQNVYTQSPVESRLAGLNQLEKTLSVN